MGLIILDPNLDGEAGHHLAYDLAIAREAMARGETATIIANRRFPSAEAEGVRIVPHFTETCYALCHDDPVTGRFDDYRHFNDLLQAELAALPRNEFRATDAVLVPTVTEIHLAGFIGWMKGFDPAEAPVFLIHLMMPSGMAVEDGAARVEDPLRALFYRLADRAAHEPGPPVHLFASGGQHAAEYGALFGRAVAPHPLPLRPEPGARVAGRRALLFAGDARADKGIGVLPDLVPRLAEAHPDWTFAAHVNAAHAWGPARAAAEALAGIAAGLPALALAGGRLPPEEYLALLQGARIALFPYDPDLYRRKSSGVLWEAVSLGLPLIVPAGTWLAHEARHWGAGHVTYAAQDAEAIAAAFAAALPRIAELEAASAAASARYRAANGAAALLDQIAALWVRHKATAMLAARPRGVALDLGRLEAGWHRPETVEGRPARWTTQDPVIAFDWPFEEGWEVRISVQAMLDAKQVESVQASANGAPVAAMPLRDGRGMRLLLRGPGPGRAAPRVELRLRLPFTRRPANDARDLGLLVSGIRVGPASAAPGQPAALPQAHILGRAGPGGGWPVAPAVSGEVAAAAGAPCVLAFRLRAEVAAARGLVLHVNGVPVPLTVSAEPGGTWLATAALPPAVLRLAGARGTWDLVADGTNEAPVLLSVAAAETAGTALPGEAPPEALPPPASRPAGPGPWIRWDLSEGFGGEEGPFPDLGIPAGVRWVLAREARLVLEATEAGAVRLAIRHRGLLPRQAVRVALNGGAATTVEAAGGGLKAVGEMVLDLDLAAGANTLSLGFAGAVREPGTGRELVLLVERAELARG
ncbi:hypothetical protein [Roseomonas sp. HF4]|uniref:hypothetical protein n=1 Tax=Roseomonas sp. HF4 TaxID=2562313 RepID=UPI001485BCB4|nr:hypothetical protein [Roseomonas sp. HF4]